MNHVIKLAVTGLASLIMLNCAAAANVSLSPTENLTLMAVNDFDNPFHIGGGGTCAGGTNYVNCWIFERFVLPAATPDAVLTKAEFVLHATSTPEDPAPLNVYLISDGWQRDDMDRYNAPYPGSEGGPLLSFSAASGAYLHLDLTGVVNDAYHGDHVITLLIGTPDYVFNYQQFDQVKTLELTISAVPEPEGYAMLLAGLGLLGWATRRSKAA